MEFRDLKALVSIAEVGSISGAAQKLNLTQPGLSALLRRLEGELNVRLVNRHTRGVTLTVEGRELLEYAYRIINDVAEASSALKKIGEDPVGTVRIGLPTSVAAGVVPTLVCQIVDQYPLIRIRVVEAMSGTLMEMLQIGALDLAILFDVEPLPGLRSIPILRESLQLIVRSDHHYATAENVTFAQVSQLPLILPSSAHSIRQFVDRISNAEGLPLKVVADIDSFSGLVGLVNDLYATILPPFLLMNDVRMGSLKSVPIAEPALEWTLHLATRLDSVRPRAAMVVGSLMSEICISMVESGKWPAKTAYARQ